MSRGAGGALRRVGGVGLVVLIAAGGWWGWQEYLKPAPIERIEALVADGAAAVEAESVLGLSGVLAQDFRAEGLERAAVLGQAQRFFAQSEELGVAIVHILHEDPDPPPEAERARALVTVKVTGKTGGTAFQGLAGGGADVFDLTFGKRGGEWKITSARRVQGTDAETLREQLNDGGNPSG